MIGKYVIIDLRSMDFMKDDEGEIILYDTFSEAYIICGMYEFEDVWIMQLVQNYKEEI